MNRSTSHDAGIYYHSPESIARERAIKDGEADALQIKVRKPKFGKLPDPALDRLGVSHQSMLHELEALDRVYHNSGKLTPLPYDESLDWFPRVKSHATRSLVSFVGQFLGLKTEQLRNHPEFTVSQPNTRRFGVCSPSKGFRAFPEYGVRTQVPAELGFAPNPIAQCGSYVGAEPEGLRILTMSQDPELIGPNGSNLVYDPNGVEWVWYDGSTIELPKEETLASSRIWRRMSKGLMALSDVRYDDTIKWARFARGLAHISGVTFSIDTVLAIANKLSREQRKAARLRVHNQIKTRCQRIMAEDLVPWILKGSPELTAAKALERALAAIKRNHTPLAQGAFALAKGFYALELKELGSEDWIPLEVEGEQTLPNGKNYAVHTHYQFAGKGYDIHATLDVLTDRSKTRKLTPSKVKGQKVQGTWEPSHRQWAGFEAGLTAISRPMMGPWERMARGLRSLHGPKAFKRADGVARAKHPEVSV